MWIHLGKLNTSARMASNPAEIQTYVPIICKKQYFYARQLCLQQSAIVLSFCISKLKCAALLIVLGTRMIVTCIIQSYLQSVDVIFMLVSGP